MDKRHRTALLSAASMPPRINGDSRPFAVARQVARPPSVLYLKTAPFFIHRRAAAGHATTQAVHVVTVRRYDQLVSQLGRFDLRLDRAGRAISAVGRGSERAGHVPALWPWVGITAQRRDLFLFSFNLNKILKNVQDF
jgi:hypothetical protein